MPVSTKIDLNEFRLMRDYIEKNCGIHITDEKMYLVETRLTTLMVEKGCHSFTELYRKATADYTNSLRDKIVDAMTTNETLWFRDMSPFIILEEVLLPELVQEIKAGRKLKIRIWCAACSTGQEPYSVAMTIQEFLRRNGSGIRPEHFEIVGTDISPTVLYLAMAGRYDNLAISRGLSQEYKDRYFELSGKVWAVSGDIKKMVTFRKMNLQENFTAMGKQDIVFCRNVLIYFSDLFKKDILSRLCAVLQPAGYLFLGSSESIINYSTAYQMQRHTRGLYYQTRQE
jgi:chemotaxis protein methyltransferase CheR